MILAFDMLGVSINVLLVIYVVVALLMVLVILMQRPKQEGLGAAFGSGTTDQLFGARTTNVLQKSTVYLGTIFFVLTLVLAILIARRNKIESLVKDQPVAEEQAATPATQPEKGTPTPPAGEKPAKPGADDKAGTPAPGEKPADGTAKPDKPVDLKPAPAPEPPPAEPEVGTPPAAPAKPAPAAPATPAPATESKPDGGAAAPAADGAKEETSKTEPAKEKGAAAGALLGAAIGGAAGAAIGGEEAPAGEEPAKADESKESKKSGEPQP